jgi:hypothetical protein
MEEIWKDVIGYEGIYQVSNLGNIKSVYVDKTLSPPINQYGYLYHGFRKNKKRNNILIHRVVAIAFLDNPNLKPCVNHKNGIKTDNRVENLEWVTYQENMNHSVFNNLCAKGEKIAQSKLTELQVSEIREKYKNQKMTYLNLASEYNVSFSLIGQIIKNNIWKK